MLKVTRWFIKAGMIYLAAGVLLLAVETIPAVQIEVNLLPVYWHMIAIRVEINERYRELKSIIRQGYQ